MGSPDNFILDIPMYCKNCPHFEVYDDKQDEESYYLGPVKYETKPEQHIICCQHSKRCKQIYERIKEELTNEGS